MKLRPHPDRCAAGLASQLTIVHLPIASIRPNSKNARAHSQRQLTALKATISELGFTNPILIDDTGMILAGHARFSAAGSLGMAEVPTITLRGLTPAQKTAVALADNKLSDMSVFDPELLADQLRELCAVDFAIELTGFSTAEVDILLEAPNVLAGDPADVVSEPLGDAAAASRIGDLWQLDNHVLLVGDALKRVSYERLLSDQLAAMVFADPPYNVKIQGHVSGLGKARHREFAMASGEMTKAEFQAFLETYMEHAARFSTDGSIHYHCIDWRSADTMFGAGGKAYTELKAVCVWDKSNAGMGSLYRSKHELVLVFKNGTAPHVNNVNLGRDGRYRTNVWSYPGNTSFSRARAADLAAHPTVKPVALVADAIRDCSRRGDLILDPFAGSGTIFLAAERTGRRAAAIELDPVYVDAAITRWQQHTGKEAVLTGTGQTFAQVAAARSQDSSDEPAPLSSGEKADD